MNHLEWQSFHIKTGNQWRYRNLSVAYSTVQNHPMSSGNVVVLLFYQKIHLLEAQGISFPWHGHDSTEVMNNESNKHIYYMAQMVGVLWLVDGQSITLSYGPENFIRRLWLVNKLGNNILVMDRLWLLEVWLGDGAHFLARALHLRNTEALVNVQKTCYDEEKTAH